MSTVSKRRSWTDADLQRAVKSSTSNRQVLIKLKLREAGGNYDQLKKYIQELAIPTNHFRGMACNKGLRGIGKPLIPLEKILTLNSTYQSFKLKTVFSKLG